SANTMTITVTDSSGDTAVRTVTINPSTPLQSNVSGSGEIDNLGTIDISAGTTTLNSDMLFNNRSNPAGTVIVENSGQLTLDGTRVFGGTIFDNNIVEITALNSFNGVTLKITAGDQLKIDSAATLDLVNGATISGGIITNNSSAPGIQVLGSST